MTSPSPVTVPENAGKQTTNEDEALARLEQWVSDRIWEYVPLAAPLTLDLQHLADGKATGADLHRLLIAHKAMREKIGDLEPKKITNTAPSDDEPEPLEWQLRYAGFNNPGTPDPVRQICVLGAGEIERLKRLLYWCRRRLRPTHRERLDDYLDNPRNPMPEDFLPIVQSGARHENPRK